MSYDVTIREEWFNYTSNMRQFFIDFGAYPLDWNEKPTEEVAEVITAALQRIVLAGAEQLDAYDAPNGWGNWESAMRWLIRVRNACRANPQETVEATA